MKKFLLYFIDNIAEAISLQISNFEKEVNNHMNSDMNVQPIVDKDKHFMCLGQKMMVCLDGTSITINDDFPDEKVKEFIKDNIISLFNNYDSIQFVVDCNLDDNDRYNTSHKFVKNLFDIAKKHSDKIIITIVSAHHHTNQHIKQVLDELDNKIQKKVKFLSRPMNNNLCHYFWDENQSSSGRYEIGNIIYEKYNKDRKFEIIENLLYENSSSANYFGILLSRFLKDKSIEENI